MIRIGQGFDVHRTVTGRRLRLGGVTIPCDFGLDGHSDADVLLHAVMDAILGALALGDIGHWFPDTDSRYKDSDSSVLLRFILEHAALADWQLGNLDTTVLAQAPRLAPHIAAVRTSLARLLDADPGQVSVKATTMEGLGPIGSGAGIAAQAIVLLQRRSPSAAPATRG